MRERSGNTNWNRHSYGCLVLVDVVTIIMESGVQTRHVEILHGTLGANVVLWNALINGRAVNSLLKVCEGLH